MEEKHFSDSISINGRIISQTAPTYILCEIGVNHNGDIEMAKNLVDVAKDCGADAVKFQAFKTKNLVTENAPQATYQKENLQLEQSQSEMLAKLELSFSDLRELKAYCDHKNITMLVTPFDDESLKEVVELGMQALKISSGDLTNHPFLLNMAKTGLPIILSTGMATMKEVEDAVAVIRETGNKDLVLLHCTSDYPCSPEDCNLNVLKSMQNKFDCIIGYSDHTASTVTPSIAVALGSKLIEKHFTLDKNLAGPDHKASLSPDELKEMIHLIRETESNLGSHEKKPTVRELETLKVARKSIVTSRTIKSGSTISENDLAIKRPGTGISPQFLDEIIGKTATVEFAKDHIIEWEELK